jgi:hypothetical protein
MSMLNRMTVLAAVALLVGGCGQAARTANAADGPHRSTTTAPGMCWSGNKRIACPDIPQGSAGFDVGVSTRNGAPNLVVRLCSERLTRVQLIWTPDMAALQARADAKSHGDAGGPVITSAERVVEMNPTAFKGTTVIVAPLPIDLNPTFDPNSDYQAGPVAGWMYVISGGSAFSYAYGSLPQGPWPTYPSISTADGADQVTSVDQYKKDCATGD